MTNSHLQFFMIYSFVYIYFFVNLFNFIYFLATDLILYIDPLNFHLFPPNQAHTAGLVGQLTFVTIQNRDEPISETQNQK